MLTTFIKNAYEMCAHDTKSEGQFEYIQYDRDYVSVMNTWGLLQVIGFIPLRSVISLEASNLFK